VNDVNIVSTNNFIEQTQVKNIGFSILDATFIQHGWHRIKNEMDYICYTKKGFETDIFEIKIAPKTIHVGIPIHNSPFQFNTTFHSYFQASEYMETRFIEYIERKKNETNGI